MYFNIKLNLLFVTCVLSLSSSGPWYVASLLQSMSPTSAPPRNTFDYQTFFTGSEPPSAFLLATENNDKTRHGRCDARLCQVRGSPSSLPPNHPSARCCSPKLRPAKRRSPIHLHKGCTGLLIQKQGFKIGLMV